MLHIVYADPTKSSALDDCLSHLKKDDSLLLMGDAVQAVTMDKYREILEDIDNLYLNRVSIEALGLMQWPGRDIGSDELVVLIKDNGSPVTWK